MRILIVIGVPRQIEAGAAGVVLNHARELRNRGHEVDCWFLDDLIEPSARARKFAALRFARRVAKEILNEPRRYDVVNLHAPWGCSYGVARRRLSGAPPYVLTMQGSEERFVTAMKAEHHKGRASDFSWKNRAWHRIYHQTMYDFSIRTADYGAVANREAWILAELKYGCEPGRIRYVPNGVGDQFFIARLHEGKSALRLLFVGTWVDRKGIYYLAEGFSILAKKDPLVRLSVVGCGSTEDHVKSFFSPEARDRVDVTPFVETGKMPALYAEHDVFVFPSLVEGMPLTLLEAMASGMAVVTTASNGMADVVENGFNGLLVPPADAQGLVQATQRFCESRELRCRLGREAQNTMRRYSWRNVTAQLEEVLQRAVQGVRS